MKTKSKVLFSSFLAIIFCLSLMVGATFALFTSESKVNVAVTSGKVSVVATAQELKMYSGVWNEEENAYVSEEVTENFSNGGSAYIEENTVTLDRITPMDKVEFDIVIHNDSNVNVLYQTKIELVDGASLYTGLKVSVDGKTYDGMTAYSNWQVLVPGSEDIVVPVSIELPQGAGNTYQDLGCKIAYSVSAIQGNAHVEQPANDENAVYIYNASDLRLFAASVNAGNKFTDKTVLLMSDIDLENEEWTPIQKFDGVFDGNGKTIANLYINQPDSNSVGFFGEISSAEAVVRNLTFENATVVGRSYTAIVCGNGMVGDFDNITIKGDVKVTGRMDVAAITGYTYGKVSNITIDVNKGSFIEANINNGSSANVAGVVGYLAEGSGVVEKVVSNIDVHGSSYGVGGIVGMAQYGTNVMGATCSANVSIYDDLSNYATTIKRIGGIVGDWMNSAGSIVTVNDVVFTGTLSAKSSDGVEFTDFYNGGLVGRCWNSGPGGILVLNGVAYQWVTDGMYAVLDTTSAVATLSEDDNISHYEIYNKLGLSYFAEQVNEGNTYSNELIKLTNNIDLAGINWTPIGLTGDVAGFQGTFDGQNHVISNLTIDQTETPKYQSAGLFGSVRNALVKNFTVVNADIKNLTTGSATTCGSAVVVGASQFASTIENVHVKGASVSSNRMVAAIAGYFVGTVSGCSVDDVTLTATPDNFSGSYDNGDKVGAIVATTNGVTNITNNSVSNVSILGYRDLGGVAGAANCGDVSGNTVDNVTIVVDQITNHYEFKDVNANAVVGRLLGGEVGNNSVGETNISKVLINAGMYDEDPSDFLAEGYTYVMSGDKYLIVKETESDAIVLNANTTETLTTAKNIENAEITLASGNYTTLSGVANGVTIIGSEDGSTIINQSSGVSGALTGSYKNTTITNVTFSGSNAARWTYSTGDSVFENCVFDGEVYGFHVDDAYGGTITFNNCTFIGFNAFAATGTYYFNNCTFLHSGSYGHTNMWGTGYFNNCTFGENVTWDVCGSGVVYIDGKVWVNSDDALEKALKSDNEQIHVVLNQGLSLNANDAYLKLGSENTKSIVIDGNGNTLTLSTTYWSRLDLKNPEATLTLKNMNLTSSQESGTWNSYDVTLKCNVNLENVVLEKALAIDAIGKTATLKNVKINESHDYYALWIVAGSNVTVDGLEVVSAGRGIKIDSEYVENPQLTTLNIKNATFDTVKKAAILVDSPAGANIICENINIENCVSDSENVVWVDSDAQAYFAMVIVEGATKIQE